MSTGKRIWDILYPTVFLLLVMILCIMIVLVIAGLITGERNAEALQEEVGILPLLVSLLAYVITLLYQRRYVIVEEARFGKGKNRWKVWQIVLACALATGAGMLWSHVIQSSFLMEWFPGYTLHAAGAFEGQPLPLLLAATVAAGPLAEEWIFRGMTYRRARAVMNRPLAMLLSAVLFGAYHANMIQFVYALPLGILFAWYYEKSGSLLTPVLAPMAVNFGACILSLF